MTAYLIDTATEAAQLVAILAAVAAALAVIVGPRRAVRVLHAVIAVARRHAPRWLIVALNVALAIPGPVDELIVLAIIGGLIAVKPVMRADMVASVGAAWSAPSAPRSPRGPLAARLAAVVLAGGLFVAPAVILAPTASAVSGAASFVIGHARHHAHNGGVR